MPRDAGAGHLGFFLYEAKYSGDASDAASPLSLGEHKLVTWDITSTELTFAPATATEGDPVTLTATITDQPLDSLASVYSGDEYALPSSDTETLTVNP
jgi:hypothetical protein